MFTTTVALGPPARLVLALIGFAILLLHHASIAADDENVTWVNRVNASVDTTGTVLQKTGGCDGCADAARRLSSS